VTGPARVASTSFQSPIEERPCILFHYAFIRAVPEAGDDEGVTLDVFNAGTIGRPFYVEHEEERVLVDPTDADVRLPSPLPWVACDEPRSSLITWTKEEGPPDSVQAFMGRCVELHEERVDPHRHKVSARHPATQLANATETVRAFFHQQLEPGDQVYVLGRAKPIPGDMDTPADVLTLFQKSDPPPPSERSYLERFYHMNDVPDLDSLLLISTESEEELGRKLSGQIGKYVLLGALLCAFYFYVLYAYFQT